MLDDMPLNEQWRLPSDFWKVTTVTFAKCMCGCHWGTAVTSQCSLNMGWVCSGFPYTDTWMWWSKAGLDPMAVILTLLLCRWLSTGTGGPERLCWNILKYIFEYILNIFKSQLDVVLGNWLWVALLEPGAWTRWLPEIPALSCVNCLLESPGKTTVRLCTIHEKKKTSSISEQIILPFKQEGAHY